MEIMKEVDLRVYRGKAGNHVSGIAAVHGAGVLGFTKQYLGGCHEKSRVQGGGKCEVRAMQYCMRKGVDAGKP